MFISPEKYLWAGEPEWPRMAAKALLPDSDDEKIKAFAVHLALAFEDGEFDWRPTHQAIGYGYAELNFSGYGGVGILMRDVAQWAKNNGFDVAGGYIPYLDLTNPSVAIESAETVEDESPTLPKLLTTPDIGKAFIGINGWTGQQWAKNIGKAGWAKPAKTDGGGRPKPDLWNPVELVKCLLKKEGNAESLVKAFDKAFRTHRLLADWQSEWANYAEHWGINTPT